MPYCTVCKIETDFEYDIALSNGEYLHYSCILMLQMRKRENESLHPHIMLARHIQINKDIPTNLQIPTIQHHELNTSIRGTPP